MSKTVIITGGSRGIGAACVRRFALEGYNIAINYKKNDNAVLGLIEELSCSPELQPKTKIISIKADVSRKGGVESLFQQVDEQFESVDVLVNNVGILYEKCKVVDLSEKRLSSVFRTNVNSAFLCSVEAIKRMSTKFGHSGGSIINVSSAAARLGAPNEYVDYAASKGAMDTLTRGLSLEVSSEGIRVNCVRPGYIYTDIHADGGEPNRVDRIAEQIPLGRGGQPKEVANAIFWLASDEASFVTGSYIDLAGGR